MQWCHKRTDFYFRRWTFDVICQWSAICNTNLSIQLLLGNQGNKYHWLCLLSKGLPAWLNCPITAELSSLNRKLILPVHLEKHVTSEGSEEEPGRRSLGKIAARNYYKLYFYYCNLNHKHSSISTSKYYYCVLLSTSGTSGQLPPDRVYGSINFWLFCRKK